MQHLESLQQEPSYNFPTKRTQFSKEADRDFDKTILLVNVTGLPQWLMW
jgi:hypothetical protein